MARIKIKDLPKGQKIKRQAMRNVMGGALYSSTLVRFDATTILPSKELTHMPALSMNCGSAFPIKDVSS